MFKRIKSLLEAIMSPEESDIFNTYSKPTPEYVLDKLIKSAKNKGYIIKIISENDDEYVLDIDYENEHLTKKKISKKQLLLGNISLEDIIY
jgi:hypothetical protein